MKLNLKEYTQMDDFDRYKILYKLVNEYTLCGNSRVHHYCFDGDLEELFADSNIEHIYDETLYKAKEYKYDDDTGELLGGMEFDYIETIKLVQDGETYLCQAFFTESGCGLEYGLALLNIYRS